MFLKKLTAGSLIISLILTWYIPNMHARHLIAEGLQHRRIYLTGSPMKEVLDYYMPKIKESKAVESLSLTVKGNIFWSPLTGKKMLIIRKICFKILTVLNKLAEDYNFR